MVREAEPSLERERQRARAKVIKVNVINVDKLVTKRGSAKIIFKRLRYNNKLINKYKKWKVKKWEAFGKLGIFWWKERRWR